jgi:hypothetical protein
MILQVESKASVRERYIRTISICCPTVSRPFVNRTASALAQVELRGLSTSTEISLPLKMLRPQQFAEVAPSINPEFDSIVHAFVETVTAAIPVRRIRHILHYLLEAQSPSFENHLCVMLSRISLKAEDLEALFDAPFQSATDKLFSRVVRSLRLPFTKLVDFVGRAADVASATCASVLCDGCWDGTRQLLAAVPADFDDADWATIIGRLPTSEMDDLLVSEIFPKCHGDKSLLAILEILSERSNDIDLANNVLHKLLMLDGKMYEFRKRIRLYLDVVRILLGTKLTFGETTIGELFEAIQSILRVGQMQPLFPLMSNEAIKHWIGILNREWDTETFVRYRDAVHKTEEMLASCMR